MRNFSLEIPLVRKVLLGIGIAGIFGAISVTILTSVQVYQNPGKFSAFPTDTVFLGIFSVLFVLAGLLSWFWKGKLLLAVTCLAGLGLILIPVVMAGSGPAFLTLIVFWVSAWLIGESILAFVIKNSPFNFGEYSLLSMVTGMAVLAAIIYALGWVGGYYPIVAWGLVLGAIVICFPGYLRRNTAEWVKLRHFMQQRWQSHDLRFPAAVAAFWLLCVVGSYIWSIAPSVHWDALAYHLSAAQIYIENHRLVPIVENVNTTLGHYSTMLYTLTFLLQGQMLAGVLYFSCSLVTGLLTFFLGRRLINGRVGMIASLLLLSAPFVSFQASMTYNDIFVGLFFLTSVFFGIFWLHQLDPGSLMLCGAMSGFVLATKLSALPLVFVGSLFLGFFLLKKYRLSRSFWIGIFLFAGPLLAFLIPWMVRDWLWTGSPIYPLYSPVWKDVPPGATGPVAMINWPTILWDLVRTCGPLCKESPGAAMGGLPLLFVPWLYLTWSGFSRSRRWLLAFLFVFAALTLVLVFEYERSARYFIPAYSILSILAAANLEAAWQVCSRSRLRIVALTIGILASLAYLVSTRLAVTVNYWMLAERYPYSFFLGQVAAEQYLDQNLYIYPAFQYLNQQGDGRHKIFSLGNELRLYTKSQIFGPAFSVEALHIIKTASSADDLAAQLAENQYDYILIYPSEQQAFPWFYTSPALNEEFHRRYTRLEFTAHTVHVYRFYPAGVDRSGDSALNLLSNPSFEEQDPQDSPKGWVALGDLQFDPSISRARTGNAGVLLSGPSRTVLYQDVSVNLDSIYSMSYWVRPQDDGQELQLVVDWLDENKQPIKRDASLAKLSAGTWQIYTAQANMPNDARYARFYLSLSSQGTAWFDDVCFAPGDVCLYPLQ